MATNRRMGCTNPGLFEVTPERRKAGLETAEQVRHEILWDYARGAGETPEGLVAHLIECRECADLKASFGRLDSALRRKDSHVLAVCPTPETLSAYQAGELDSAARTKVAAHLEHCTPCQEDVDWLKRTAPSNVVEMPRRRWAAYAAAAAAVVVLGVATQVVLKKQATFNDLAAAVELDKDDLRATLTGKDRLLPVLEASFTAYDSGDFRGAEAKAREILATDPSEPSGLLMAGLAAYRRGDLNEGFRLVTAAERVKKSEYRCWTALQFALMTGERVGVDRECRHLDGHVRYRERVRQILQEVKRRTASLPRPRAA